MIFVSRRRWKEKSMLCEFPSPGEAAFNHSPWGMDKKEEFRRSVLPYCGSAALPNGNTAGPQQGRTFLGANEVLAHFHFR
jgi:hypothetical protein